MNEILILGTGELGDAIVASIYQHPTFSPKKHSITVTIRPSTLAGPLSPSRQAQIKNYESKNITILPLDIETSSQADLAKHFSPFTTIIHAGGMTLSPGTQKKVTDAVIASAPSTTTTTTGQKKTYIPWQFGLDYDLIGPEAGNGLFAEQHGIRATLRAQSAVDWVIVSNGLFMSFLFEPAWGVVERVSASSSDSRDADIVVTALGSMDDKLVVTTVKDIGACTAELVLVDTSIRGCPVFIAGESVSYQEIADIVERVSGKKVRREVWSVPVLAERLQREPENKMMKYHVVFASGVGLDWDFEETYSSKKCMKTIGVEEWMRKNWVES